MMRTYTATFVLPFEIQVEVRAEDEDGVIQGIDARLVREQLEQFLLVDHDNRDLKKMLDAHDHGDTRIEETDHADGNSISSDLMEGILR